MTAYEIVRRANLDMIEGEAIPEYAKHHAAVALLSHASSRQVDERLLDGGGAACNGRHMYPIFFVPPQGTTYRLVTGQAPRTQLLSANHYELEILRLLALWKGDDPTVAVMLETTLARLQSTCFAHFCGKGDCVGAGVAVLRLLSVMGPRVSVWIDELLAPMGELFSTYRGKAAMHENLPVWYLCLALSGIESDQAVQIIRAHREHLLGVLGRARLARPNRESGHYPSVETVLLATLSRLPECAGIREADGNTSRKSEMPCYEIRATAGRPADRTATLNAIAAA